MTVRWPVLFAIALVVIGGFLACNGDSDDDDDDSIDDLGDDDDSGDDDDDDAAVSGTVYPIVLAHGFFGWGDTGPADYFFKVKPMLEEAGFTVLEPNVTAVATIAQRGQELAAAIDAAFPGQRVNIIAHSQGGLDARYIISTLGWGDRVVSLTTISCPHRGSGLADVIAGLVPNFGEDIIDRILEIVGWDWDVVYDLSRDNVVNNFNPANPDVPGVAYYSYYGDGGAGVRDVLTFTYNILMRVEGCNDGIIGCESAIWGEFRGVLPADHWGEIGQLLGQTDFDWLAFYLDLATFLKDQGY